jgi:hypothetical protein
MPRFSDHVLAEFPLDPKRELYWSKCPWCPGTILWGFRKDRPESQGIGGTTLIHTSLVESTGQKESTVELDVAKECERYTELSNKDPAEFLRLLGRAGAKMKKNSD